MATSLGSPEFRVLTDPLPEVWQLHLKAALQTFRVKNASRRAEGGYGRAKGTVRSKAEPWNERRVANVSLGTKGDYVTTCRPDLVIADLTDPALGNQLTRSFLLSAVRYPGRAVRLLELGL